MNEFFGAKCVSAPQLISIHERSQIISSFKDAKTRLILLDYDGTVVPVAKEPGLGMPDAHVLNLLELLAQNKKNTIVIISGRDKNTLQNWLGHLNVTLVAEHSGWIRQNNLWKKRIESSLNWKTHVLPILTSFAQELPGCLIEEKEFSVVWHYRNADPKKSKEVAKELVDYLAQLSGPKDMTILLGNMIIELKDIHIGKNFVTQELVAHHKSDFILAIGDDTTDEDMFGVLPQHAVSIRVGMEGSRAKFSVPSQSEVIHLLNSFVKE